MTVLEGRSLAATRVVLAANGGELGVGNEQHVRIAVVKVVNLKQSRLRAAFTGPSVDGSGSRRARGSVPSYCATPASIPSATGWGDPHSVSPCWPG